MNEINKTLYIPLYGKSYVSKKGIILEDKMAEYIFEKENFSVGRKSKNKYLAYFMAMRSKIFDDFLKEKISHSLGDTVILHTGCGMDSRNLRVESREIPWYDIDLPEVINERKKYFSENDHYKMIPSDIRDKKYLKNIPSAQNAIVIMEGVSMYLKREELEDALENIAGRFGKVYALIDFYSEKAAKLSKYKNPINEVGVNTVYGMDHGEDLEKGTSLRFVKEHDMTPKRLISQLDVLEKMIFRYLYAGNIAKKLYRIFEYEK